MRRGLVELTHDPENESLLFRVIRDNKDEQGEKLLDLAYEIKLDRFKTEFLDHHADGKNKTLAEAMNSFMKETAQLQNPYTPEHGEKLTKYLSETGKGREIPRNHPAFPLEISMKWNEETEKIDFTLRGMDNDIIRTLHAATRDNIKFEHLLAITVTEKANALRQVVGMEEAASKAKAVGK